MVETLESLLIMINLNIGTKKRVKMKLLIAIVFLWGNLAQSASIPKIKFDVEKYKLKNGLTVILHKDNRLPNLTIQAWFRVGSKHEVKGKTGIAHFLEHLMFKGSKNFHGDKFERMIQANGGSNNAFTSKDYTGYYVNLPAGKLDIILQMEADRMQNLIIKPEDILKERDVVKEERRYRYDNSVDGQVYEKIFSTIFKGHAYETPVIGSMEDVHNLKKQDFEEFYKKYYTPKNAILLIGGDFKTSNAKKLVKKYFGALKNNNEKLATFSPLRPKGNQLSMKLKVAADRLSYNFPVIKAGHPDQYALDLLSSLLGDGSTSRLYKDLVYDKKVASKVSSWSYTIQETGVFHIGVQLKTGKKVKDIKPQLIANIDYFKNNLVDAKSLEKVKNQMMKSYVDSFETLGGRVRGLALNEVLFGDYSVLFKDLGLYYNVTQQDIQRVAKKYLNFNKATVLEVGKK